MKSRAISFNTVMVQAILNDRKTQTRRPMKPQPESARWDGKRWTLPLGGQCGHDVPISPYGRIGDELWVRESARVVGYGAGMGRRNITLKYLADDYLSDWIRVPHRIKDVKAGHCLSNGCFKEAARIHLIIKDVKIELIQDTFDGDMYAEGTDDWCADYIDKHGGGKFCSIRAGFKKMWDSIYSDKGFGWDKNPYVWVIDFRVKE